MYIPVLLGILILLFKLTSASVFVGCFDPLILPEIGGLVYDSYLDDCQDLCRLNSTTFSYSWPDPDDHSDFPELRICQCGFSQPAGQFLVPDSLCDYPNVQVYYLPSPSDWSFSGCLYISGVPPNTVTSLDECLNSCNGLPIAFVYYVDNHIFCSCTSIIPDPDSLQTVCGLEDWFVYSETVLPSAFIARQAAKIISMNQRESKLCPNQQEACRTPGGPPEDYECIDTTSELESCGGCIFGTVRSDKEEIVVSKYDTQVGIDCTTIEGVRRDGVTCEKGHCLAFACEEDFVVDEGVCKPV